MVFARFDSLALDLARTRRWMVTCAQKSKFASSHFLQNIFLATILTWLLAFQLLESVEFSSFGELWCVVQSSFAHTAAAHEIHIFIFPSLFSNWDFCGKKLGVQLDPQENFRVLNRFTTMNVRMLEAQGRVSVLSGLIGIPTCWNHVPEINSLQHCMESTFVTLFRLCCMLTLGLNIVTFKLFYISSIE